MRTFLILGAVLLVATVSAGETHVGDWDVTGEITASGNFATFGDSSYVVPFSGWSGNSRMVAVRQPTAVSSGVSAGFMFSNNQTSGAYKNIAQLMFLNEAIVASNKRVAQILVTTGGSTDSGKMYIRMYDGGVGTNGLVIRKDGTIEGIKFPDGETQTTAFMGATGGGSGNSASGEYSTVAGGLDNTASWEHATVGGGELNTATGSYATVGGGYDNDASVSSSTVAGGQQNNSTGYASTVSGGVNNTASGFYGTVGGGLSNTASGQYSTVGGGRNNEALANYTTIAGGGPSDEGNPTTTNNVVTDDYGAIGGGGRNQAGDNAGTTDDAPYATVGGGYANTASNYYATVGGGQSNDASGERATVAGGYVNVASGFRATVGGGDLNTASGPYATIGGGNNNTAGASFATVGGGQANTAGGLYSTVGGGYDNTASGSYSFAAGDSASATHNNSFVWSDNSGAGTSANTNTFNIWASNGVYLNGALHAASDRNKKENFEPVDSRAVLAKVAVLPMSTWNYKTEDGGYRHMGPMGQDFRAAFGLGSDDKHITTVDADGVALAAVQGLYETVNQKLEEKDAQIEALLQHNASLESRLAALEEAMAKE
jgi:hypothetical protein